MLNGLGDNDTLGDSVLGDGLKRLGLGDAALGLAERLILGLVLKLCETLADTLGDAADGLTERLGEALKLGEVLALGCALRDSDGLTETLGDILPDPLMPGDGLILGEAPLRLGVPLILALGEA